MRTVITAVAAMLAVAGLSAASAETHSVKRQCYLSVDGKVLVNNPCRVYPLGGRSYTLNTWDRGKPRRSHFAQVNADPDGTGEATWNADPNDTHAQDPLGKVRRVKGCWVNKRTRICAR
jgi:hypothetical protein